MSTRIRLLLAFLVAAMLAACGGGGGGGDDGGGGSTPPPPSADAVKVAVSYGAGVDARTRQAISRFVSVGGSVAASDNATVDAGVAGAVPVFAVDANELALLAGRVGRDGTVRLDASTTAEFLVLQVMPLEAVRALSEADLVAAIRRHAGLPALTARIEVLAGAGKPYVNDKEAINAAFAIAQAIDEAANARKQLLSASLAKDTASRMAFADYPLTASQDDKARAGGSFSLRNRTYTHFLADVKSAEGQENGVRVGASNFCFICLDPGHEDGKSDAVKIAADGAFTVTARHDLRRSVIALAMEIFGVSLNLMGVKLEIDKPTYALLVAEFDAMDALKDIMLGDKPATAIAKGIADAIVESTPNLVEILARQGAVKNGLRRAGYVLLNNLFLPLKVADNAAPIYRAGRAGADMAAYHGRTPETADACFEAGGLYGGCSAKVEITPASLVLSPGTPKTFTAKVLDARGRVLDKVPLRWSASKDAVTVSPLGNNKVEVRTKTAVEAKVTASTQFASGTAAITAPQADITITSATCTTSTSPWVSHRINIRGTVSGPVGSWLSASPTPNEGFRAGDRITTCGDWTATHTSDTGLLFCKRGPNDPEASTYAAVSEQSSLPRDARAWLFDAQAEVPVPIVALRCE